MTITRNPNQSTAANATSWMNDIDDSLEYALQLDLGRLTNVAGTNAISGRLPVSTGYTAIGNGAKFRFKPAANNTGAVTMQLQDTSGGNVGAAFALRDRDGVALPADAIIASRLYEFEYDSVEGYARMLGDLAVGSSDMIYPFLTAQFFTGAGTFTAPYDCYVRIYALGGGGSGGRNNNRSSGGAAGGTAIKTVFMSSGQQLTITPGSGGASVTTNTTAGNPGTATTVTGPGGLSLTANGGGGGNVDATTANGATGGTATGGDVNYSGQSSPRRTGSNGGTCGGAVSVFGSPASLADNTTTGQSSVAAANITAALFNNKFTPFPTQTSGAYIAATPGTAGGYGCGGGSSDNSHNSGAGGSGVVAVEFTGPVA